MRNIELGTILNPAENDVVKGAAGLLNRPSACKIKIALNRKKFQIYFCLRLLPSPLTK
jgi:hypothetical protein